MNKLLIVSDLDYTLLNKKSKLSFKTKKYVHKLSKQGHMFVLATGRPYQGCINFYNELKLTTPLICDNGGSIHFPNNHSKDIYAKIPLEIFIDFIKDIKPYIHSAYSSDFETIYFQNRNEVPKFIQHMNPPREIIEGDFEYIVKKSPINPSIFVKRLDNDKVLKIINQEKYSRFISYRNWVSNYDIATFELYAKDGSKGDALDKLIKLLNWPENQVLAFGDQMNDIEMITRAHHGVAMINGREEVKNIAKYITKKTHHKNGVIHYIKNYIKTKK